MLLQCDPMHTKYKEMYGILCMFLLLHMYFSLKNQPIGKFECQDIFKNKPIGKSGCQDIFKNQPIGKFGCQESIQSELSNILT